MKKQGFGCKVLLFFFVYAIITKKRGGVPVKYVEFKKFTDENGARPIYLFEGEEVYFREKGEQILKNLFVQELTLDYASFDGGALKGGKMNALVDAVRCFPFVSQKRLVRVTELYPTDKEFENY